MVSLKKKLPSSHFFAEGYILESIGCQSDSSEVNDEETADLTAHILLHFDLPSELDRGDQHSRSSLRLRLPSTRIFFRESDDYCWEWKSSRKRHRKKTRESI